MKPCPAPTLLAATWLGVFFLLISRVHAERFDRFAVPQDESAEYTVEVLLRNLDNPMGVTLRPTQAKRGPYELFFAESGAGRVLRVATNSLDQTDEVVVDFPLASFGQESAPRVGPSGVLFLDRKKLVVSAKDASEGSDMLSGYVVSTGKAALPFAKHDFAAGPLKPEMASQVDGMQFLGLAKNDKSVYVTTGGQASQGWVLKSNVQANRLTDLQPFVNVQKMTASGAPGGIAMSPPTRPAFLVVALMASRKMPSDSRLAFFVPSSGKLALDLPTGLHDIISLAYSPSGQLYAADFSWHDEQAGGVYRIDDAQIEGRQTCRAVKIAALVRPTSLAFSPDGSLFVTAWGADKNSKQGTLVQITGEL